MESLRRYGSPPYRVAVIHGGPGAGGEMAPVARALARRRGVLEPIQTSTSLQGQVDELAGVLETRASGPAVLVGYSWGAWLSLIVAARIPDLVAKLILVGSGPLEPEYVPLLRSNRLSRLRPGEAQEFASLERRLSDPGEGGKDALLARLGELAAKADSYEPIPDGSQPGDRFPLRAEAFQAVWEEAAGLRRDGRLMEVVRRVRCPVTAIHGEHDPHPVEGVARPLASVLDSFRLYRLPRCGHTPWAERYARERFFALLEQEIALPDSGISANP